MTRFVTLMNPRPRRASRRRRGMPARGKGGRFLSRRSKRRYHANPSRRARRRRTSTRVIYRSRPRRRSSRRRNTSVVVHANKRHSAAMRRKISLAVKAANRRRGSVRTSSRRSVSRRSVRRSVRRFGGFSAGFGGGSLLSSFKSALSRPLLMKAAGAVVASLGTGLVLNKYGSQLPLANHKYGRVIYTLGIPVLAAYVVRKKSRDLAEGLVIGGLVMTINTIVQGFRPSLNLQGPTPSGAALGAFALAGELGDGGNNFGYYPQTAGDTQGLGGANVAFPGSAWE